MDDVGINEILEQKGFCHKLPQGTHTDPSPPFIQGAVWHLVMKSFKSALSYADI